MKKNFTKVLMASASMLTLGLAYAANEANLFDLTSLLSEEVTVEWGVNEEGALPEDMINLGLPIHMLSNLPAETNPYELTFELTASLYEIADPVESEDDVDPGFNSVPEATLLQENVAHIVYLQGNEFVTNLFPEVLEVGKAYGIVLGTFSVLDLDGNVTWSADCAEWANPAIDFTVAPEVVETLEFDAALICGEEEVSLNTHSAVSVETAEAIRVNFINGLEVRCATYAIDQLGDDVVPVASGELSINRIGYAAFEKAVNFISGKQYLVTVKAWDTTDIVDEDLNVMEPILVEEYLVNGAYAMGVIGDPVFGIERGQFEEDMINLGVPVRFPDMQLPFGVVAEDCEITVSASLYGVPTGNEPMPLSLDDDDIDPGMGVDGPVALAEGVLFNVSMEGGVATAYLFPEMMEVGNHYAIVLNAVTVIAEDEIVAELPEDAYYAVEFDVVEASPVVAVNEPSWGIEGGVFPEDMINLGVPVSFPDMVLPNGVFAEECEIYVSASLYGVPTGNEPMPLSLDDDDIDPGMGVDGPVCLDEAHVFVANSEGGVVTAYLFPEQLEVGNHYAIILNAVTVMQGDDIICELPDYAYYDVDFEVVPVEVEEPLEIAPAFLAGEEEVALNSHAAVSVETADALVVNFINGPMVQYATYTIDEFAYDEEEEAMVWVAQISGGNLSVNTVGYVAFDPALTFIAGHQYVLTVKAWDVAEIWDENWNMVQPIAVEEFTFNGAADAISLGEPEWGIERGEFSEDMINLGVPVRFPELKMPFGLVAEECNFIAYAYLQEEGAEVGDDVDPGFMFDANYFFGGVEGGILNFYLFPEQLEVGKTYTITLFGVQVYDLELEELLAYAEADYEVTFTVVPSEVGPVSISSINAENGKVMFNLNGQKVNNAKGIVVLKGVKALVK